MPVAAAVEVAEAVAVPLAEALGVSVAVAEVEAELESDADADGVAVDVATCDVVAAMDVVPEAGAPVVAEPSPPHAAAKLTAKARAADQANVLFIL